MKIKKNIESILLCKYSKFMSESIDPYKDLEKVEKNNQFSEPGVYVKEDDQDWGSSGMNDIQADSE
jgi:hypothetical protein|tara:strand:- start:492 stop:689 length:198 start_codon:yes stop_codon:yes gene_type:complete